MLCCAVLCWAGLGWAVLYGRLSKLDLVYQGCCRGSQGAGTVSLGGCGYRRWQAPMDVRVCFWQLCCHRHPHRLGLVHTGTLQRLPAFVHLFMPPAYECKNYVLLLQTLQSTHRLCLSKQQRAVLLQHSFCDCLLWVMVSCTSLGYGVMYISAVGFTCVCLHRCWET